MIAASCNGMVIRIGEKRAKITCAPYIAVIYTLIMSGSVYQYAYMGALANVNIFVTAFLFLVYCLQNGKKTTQINRNIADSFIVCGGIGLLVCMGLWGEYSSFWGYISKFSMILLPWLFCKYIEMDDFLNAFLKIIFFIAITSLVLFLFPAVLNLMPFKAMINTSQWSFDNYLIYAAYHNPIYKVHQRNVGIFWEPGMYQGYLIFAMLYVVIAKRRNFRTLIFQFVMLATILTTQSTTGYMLLLPIALIVILTSVSPRRKVARTLMIMTIMAVMFVLMLNPQIVYNAVDELVPGLTKKIRIDDSGGSMGTRFYSTLVDAYLVTRNPFGIGETQIDAYRDRMLGLFGFVVDGANINTTLTIMLYYGWIPGIMYSLIMVKGCFRFFGKNMIAAVALLIFLIIVNTEPHYMTLFFTIVFMYFAQCNQNAVPLEQKS